MEGEGREGEGKKKEKERKKHCCSDEVKGTAKAERIRLRAENEKIQEENARLRAKRAAAIKPHGPSAAIARNSTSGR